ncbi:MAG: hypothetical protein K1060chlam1_00122 [Candidatus Anoxychlamydiales bacterium]|nr:hypothetical protein [Candidatus Anoxychlamydiales bacterium]
MGSNKKNKKTLPKAFASFQKGSKWQELANFISRKNRDISIIKDFEKDPNLKKIHTQRDKIFAKKFTRKKND